MANRYRHASVYIDSVRAVKLTGGTYRLNSASEPVYNDNGYDGETEAPFMSEITANTAEQVGSSGLDLHTLMLRRTKLRVAVTSLEGKVHEMKDMRVTQAETTWANQNGTHTGSYTLRAGEPNIVGG